MPGTLLHLVFAEEVYQQLFSIQKFYFMCGNLIPDETINKHLSHYRVPFNNTGFFIPMLEKAAIDLLTTPTSLTLGMYCHLYLDHYFIKNFLSTEFICDSKNNQVINTKNNKIWTTSEFFSRNGFYSAYSEINQLLIKNNIIDLSTVDSLPAKLPQTGISIFDNRREKNWKEELYEYLEQNIDYTGSILDYEKVILFLTQTATLFIKDVTH